MFNEMNETLGSAGCISKSGGSRESDLSEETAPDRSKGLSRLAEAYTAWGKKTTCHQEAKPVRNRNESYEITLVPYLIIC